MQTVVKNKNPNTLKKDTYFQGPQQTKSQLDFGEEVQSQKQNADVFHGPKQVHAELKQQNKVQQTKQNANSSKEVLQQTKQNANSSKEVLQQTKQNANSSKQVLQQTKQNANSSKQVLQQTKQNANSVKKVKQTQSNNTNHITFKTETIFGKSFKPSLGFAITSVGSLLNDDQLKLDGQLSLELITKITKSEVWGYIYYLWYYNHDKINVFISMTDNKNKASAENFSSVMKSYIMNYNVIKQTNVNNSGVFFTKERLINAVNHILKDNPNIHIPILEQLYKRLANATIQNSVKSNNANVNTNKPEITLGTIEIKTNGSDIQTDLDKINKSNIKLHLGVDIVPKKIINN